MEVDEFLYETLSPLSVSVDQPMSSETVKTYDVFRNEISLTSLQSSSAQSAVEDYFSLEVRNDTEELTEASTSAPYLSPSPALDQEPGRKLEGEWFRGNSRFKSPMLQLHKEIVDFCDFLSPTPEEQASRNTAVDCVFDVIRYIWPHCKVEIFGSFKTGLYLPTSDIDVVILGSSIKTPQMGLVALSRALSQRGIAKNIQVIAKARIPIIKFVEKRSGVAFDISFDVQNGPKAAKFIKDAVAKFPPLRPLCLILKVFLQQRELNEVYSGGLGSFALLAMLIAMLQSLSMSQASHEKNLGVLLVNFFDFYGRKLNTSDVGISCKGSGTFFLKSSKGFINNGRPFLISIEDPQAPDNDIGKNSFNYFQIRSAFAMAFATLTNAKTITGLGPNRSILGTIIRPDPLLLERKGGSNGDVTFSSLLPGAGERWQPQYDNQQGILCNWQLDNEDEEPLPRGAEIPTMNGSAGSSGKKRKANEERSGKRVKKTGKKVKENGELGKVRRHKHNGSAKENGGKKKR